MQIIVCNFLKKLYKNEFSLFQTLHINAALKKRMFFCSRTSSQNLVEQIVITDWSLLSFSVIAYVAIKSFTRELINYEAIHTKYS